ncbi:MAG: DUF1844 domain-containing protein [Candidatus Omnitrophica bacterium]|nr:DUF1844 domain-containing protein [Candidatus Omnitrophota bacterium]
MDEQERRDIDSKWLEQQERDKKSKADSGGIYHQPTFTIFLSSMSMQAMIALGRMANPVTKTTDKNLEQARFLIDTLAIVKDKTKGNLLETERSLIDESLYNLRIMYLEENEKEV